MSDFEILRTVTKPTTDEKAREYVRARYGNIRDTIGSDDLSTLDLVAATASTASCESAPSATAEPGQRSVPLLSHKEESFLAGIGLHGKVMGEEVLTRHSSSGQP